MLQSQKYLKSRPAVNWHPYFPHTVPRPQQVEAMDLIFNALAKGERGIVIEGAPGMGKMALGVGTAEASRAQRIPGANLIVTSTKSLVDQYLTRYPKSILKPILGRNEHPCAYYHARGIPAQADEIPCYTLVKKGLCPHYVPSLAEVPKGVQPCSYYLARAEAESGGIIVCSGAYFLVSKLFHNRPEQIAMLVLDEVDQLAEIARTVFTYDITDYHLEQLIALVERYDKKAARRIGEFLEEMVKIAKLKPARKPTLLEPHEIELLLSRLQKVSLEETEEKLGEALARGKIDPVEHRDELVALEDISLNLKRYIKSFIFALEDETRYPLNYIFAYFTKRISPAEKVRYRLCVRAHYVAPLIRKCLENVEFTLAYSATIGNRDPFRFETGIPFEVHSFPSTFPAENGKIFLPSDVPSLAKKVRGPQDKYNTLCQAFSALKEFKKQDIRSLFLVESEEERQQFLELVGSSKLGILTYGDGLKPREALFRFQKGEGNVLLGTAAHYARGIDLPDKITEVTLYLRPGYGRPDDPAVQFEEKWRFREKRWQIWNWRASNKVSQVQGRNRRNERDKGVTFLLSQQFARILPGGFPEWLRPSFISDKEMQECVKETIRFLRG